MWIHARMSMYVYLSISTYCPYQYVSDWHLHVKYVFAQPCTGAVSTSPKRPSAGAASRWPQPGHLWAGAHPLFSAKSDHASTRYCAPARHTRIIGSPGTREPPKDLPHLVCIGPVARDGRCGFKSRHSPQADCLPILRLFNKASTCVCAWGDPALSPVRADLGR